MDDSDTAFAKQLIHRPYTPPQPSKEAEDEEAKQTIDQFPVLKEVVKHLDKDIEATDSIKKALEVAAKFDTNTENALIGLNIARQQLEAERIYILARVERAKR